MVEPLTAMAPAQELGLPEKVGAASLAECPWCAITSVVPGPGGRRGAVSDALMAGFGTGLAKVGATNRGPGVEVRWMGRGLWFVFGPEPSQLAAAAPDAALTDQSDGWCRLLLTGADAPAVMIRLCPIDIAPAAFPVGATARTEVAHMPGSVTAMKEGFEIMVPRSYAASLVHHLRAAMRSVAALGALGP